MAECLTTPERRGRGLAGQPADLASPGRVEAALKGRDGGSGPDDDEAMALARAARLAPRALNRSGRLNGVRHVVHCLARVRNPSVFVVPHPSTVSGLKSSLF